MDKKYLLEKYGDSKVQDVMGILHNYTKNDSCSEHENLDATLKKWKTYKLKDALPFLENSLYF